IIADGQIRTYRELDADADRLAAQLAEYGAGPETVVALSMPRSAALLTAIWATAKTGAAFLPVDPKHPLDRIEHMLGDSRARLGVTVAAHRAALPDSTQWLVLSRARESPS